MKLNRKQKFSIGKWIKHNILENIWVILALTIIPCFFAAYHVIRLVGFFLIGE